MKGKLRNLLAACFKRQHVVEYCDPQVMIQALEISLNENFKTIKNNVETAQVKVTAEQIYQFLDEKFSNENLPLKLRLKNYYANLQPSDSVYRGAEGMIHYLNHVTDRMEAEQYKFTPYTLEYYERCVDTLQNKTATLLDIIEKLSTHNHQPIQQHIKDLDIALDETGKIDARDMDRLIRPTLINYTDLMGKSREANDLRTYFTFKLSRQDLAQKGWHESQIYPCRALQVNHLFNDTINTNVPLSLRQRAALKAKNHGLRLVQNIEREF